MVKILEIPQDNTRVLTRDLVEYLIPDDIKLKAAMKGMTVEEYLQYEASLLALKELGPGVIVDGSNPQPFTAKVSRNPLELARIASGKEKAKLEALKTVNGVLEATLPSTWINFGLKANGKEEMSDAASSAVDFAPAILGLGFSAAKRVAPRVFASKGSRQAIAPKISPLLFETNTSNIAGDPVLNLSAFYEFVDHTDWRTGISYFKKPVSIEDLKKYVIKHLDKTDFDLNFDEFVDAIKKCDVNTLIKYYNAGIIPDASIKARKIIIEPTESAIIKSFDEMASLAKKLGLENPTVSGYILQPLDKYSGFILGTRKLSENDSSIKLLEELIDNYSGDLAASDKMFVKDQLVSSPSSILYYSSDPTTGLGGYYRRKIKDHFINLRALPSNECLRSTLIHEGISHVTDKSVFDINGVRSNYLELLSNLDNASPESFKTPNSYDIRELRATLTELKNTYAPDGKVSTLKEVIDNKSIGELCDDLSKLNSYGQDYAEAIKSSIKENPKNAEKMKELLKKGLLLPGLAAPTVLAIPENKYGGKINYLKRYK